MIKSSRIFTLPSPSLLLHFESCVYAIVNEETFAREDTTKKGREGEGSGGGHDSTRHRLSLQKVLCLAPSFGVCSGRVSFVLPGTHSLGPGLREACRGLSGACVAATFEDHLREEQLREREREWASVCKIIFYYFFFLFFHVEINNHREKYFCSMLLLLLLLLLAPLLCQADFPLALQLFLF